MRFVSIEYTLQNPTESIKTCVILPVGTENSLLKYGDQMGIGKPILQRVLYDISVLQGYVFDSLQIDSITNVE